MFTKTSIALAIIVSLASGAIAAPKYQTDNGPKITMPSATAEGNTVGWFMDR
jgi:hypothetical protein